MRHSGYMTVCLIGLLITTTAAESPQTSPVPWATDSRLREQLTAPASVSWSNTALSQALASLGAAQHVAVVLDRRVDADQLISITLPPEPLGDLLEKIGSQLHLGYSQFGPVAYFGPRPSAQRLRTLAAMRIEEVRGLPTASVRKFLQMRASHWDDLAEPRQLLAQLAEEADVEVTGTERIPHDLWRAADLPQLTWIDRLTLLTTQFDLTFQWDKTGKRIELVPVPENVFLTRTYPTGQQGQALATRWARVVPAARVTVEGAKIKVEGLLEDHERIEQRLGGTPTQRTVVNAGKEVAINSRLRKNSS